MIEFFKKRDFSNDRSWNALACVEKLYLLHGNNPIVSGVSATVNTAVTAFRDGLDDRIVEFLKVGLIFTSTTAEPALYHACQPGCTELGSAKNFIKED